MAWTQKFIILVFISSFTINLYAQDSTKKYPEKNWGIGVAIRSATVPYFSEEENNTNSIAGSRRTKISGFFILGVKMRKSGNINITYLHEFRLSRHYSSVELQGLIF